MLLRNRRVPALLIVLLGVTAGGWGAEPFRLAMRCRPDGSGFQFRQKLRRHFSAANGTFLIRVLGAESDKPDQAKSDQSKPDQSKPADAQPAQDQSQSAGADSGIFVFKNKSKKSWFTRRLRMTESPGYHACQDAFRVLENGNHRK